MSYADPYIGEPDHQRLVLQRTLVVSLILHGGLVLFFLTFAGSRFLDTEDPTPPPTVYRVALVAPDAPEIAQRLPDRIKDAPRPATGIEEVPIPGDPEEEEPEPEAEAAEEAPVPPEIRPEPAATAKHQPKADPKPKSQGAPKDTPQSDLSKLLAERMAALDSKLKDPPPGDRRNTNRNSGGRTGRSANLDEVREWADNSPEGRYLAKIRARIINHWIVSPRVIQQNPDITVHISVRLTPEGRLDIPSDLDQVISHPSGNESFDQSALRAVRVGGRTLQLGPPPPGLQDEDIVFRFKPSDMRR